METANTLAETSGQSSTVLRNHHAYSRAAPRDLLMKRQGLLVHLRELARKRGAQLDTLEYQVGMGLAERTAPRDAQPEEDTR